MTKKNNEPLFPVTTAIIRVNSEWHIDGINKQAEEILDTPADKLLGRPAEEFLGSREKFSELLSLCRLAREGGNVSSHPVRISTETEINGNSFLTTILPLTDEQQSPCGSIVYLEKPAGRPLDLYILNSMGDGVFTVNRNWKITSFNRAAQKITGWSPDQVMGKSCSEVFESNICRSASTGRSTVRLPDIPRFAPPTISWSHVREPAGRSTPSVCARAVM